jgi:hypothetical protein
MRAQDRPRPASAWGVEQLLARVPGPREPVEAVRAWVGAAVARLEAVAAASGDASLTADALALAAVVRATARDLGVRLEAGAVAGVTR